ncbi:MAG: CBS domain-containing protein [Myxococcales bacterium]|nr:CBS domain-containing protein [Myxococcales bacterium]
MTVQATDPGWPRPTRVREIMTVRPTLVGPDQSVGFALELMLWGAIHHLIVAQNGRLLGIVSDRDMLTADPAARVRDVMSVDVETVTPDEDVSEVAARMVASTIHCLPVMEDSVIVGIVTSTDVLAERGRLLFKQGPGTVPSAATVMTASPFTVRVESDVVDAVMMMLARQIRHLPVVDEAGRAVGMLSERDLRGSLGPEAFAGREDRPRAIVGEVMTRSVVAVRQDESLFGLGRHFLDDRVGALVVVDDDDVVVGIVSYVDLLRFLLGDSLADD